MSIRVKRAPAKAGQPMRFINEVALAYRGEGCLPWPYSLTESGYGNVRDGDRTLHVHRLICARVHGPAPAPDHHAAHDCGRRDCCAPLHIDWKSPKANAADRRRHGTASAGPKLTLGVVPVIRALRDLTTREISEALEVGGDTIGRVRRKASWK